MTEGMEELSAGPVTSPGPTSPISSTVDTGQVPEEKPEETEAAVESGEEGVEGTAEGGAGGCDGEHLGALGIVALPGTCCVCVEMEQINNCLHSEKICILPILACLLSLALCTAGLKWVFVDKIFEYNPPTHLDPKPIGQDPIIISADPTRGLSTVSLSTAIAIAPGHPEVSTPGPHMHQSPGVTQSDPHVTLKYNAERPTTPKQTLQPQTTQESNDIIIPTVSATSTTTTAKTSSHVTRCSDSQKNYCVNGGECFTLEIMPGSTKFLCRCPNEFTGDRCQNYVMASFYKAEELYQKRILTITGICIALLVVGIMCVVAYCKTKKQRKKLHHRLRQRLQNKRKSSTKTGTGHNSARGRQMSNLPLQDLQHNNCNGMTAQPTAEETESRFSTSKYALFEHEPTLLTHISSQRFVSAVTSPSQLSPVCQTSPATPGSPPSEMSAPLSSLAISVPSVALSPSGEEECPLLLSKKSSGRDDHKRTSAHYNHGHVAHSSPPSPLFSVQEMKHQTTGDCDTRASSHMVPASPAERNNTNSINGRSNNRAEGTSGFVLHSAESSCSSSMLVSGTDEPQDEHTHVLTAQLLGDSSRTNPPPLGHDTRGTSSSSTTKQGPVAV